MAEAFGWGRLVPFQITIHKLCFTTVCTALPLPSPCRPMLGGGGQPQPGGGVESLAEQEALRQALAMHLQETLGHCAELRRQGEEKAWVARWCIVNRHNPNTSPVQICSTGSLGSCGQDSSVDTWIQGFPSQPCFLFLVVFTMEFYPSPKS